MVRVDIVTDRKNFNTNQFINCLKDKNLIYIKNNKKIYDSANNQLDFLVTEYSNKDSVISKAKYVLLCCERLSQIKFIKNAVVLLDNSEFMAYDIVPPYSYVVSCGVGEKNTISLSGINECSLALNIARKVRGFEIQECVINNICPIKNIYTAIFAYSILVLSHKEDALCVRNTKAIQ